MTNEKSLPLDIVKLAGLLGLYAYLILQRYKRRRISQNLYVPRIHRNIQRHEYLSRLYYGSDTSSISMIRMKRVTFFKLCDCLRERNLLHDTLNVTLEEQVAVFLHIVGHNVRNRVVGHNFMRSGETVSRYFNEVLRAIGELRRELIRRPSLNTHSRITSSSRFMPYFKVNKLVKLFF